jgi:uncharacterized membrane protein
MEESIDVISFAEPSKAYQALHVLQETDAQARIGLLEAAVVERTSDGRLQMNEVGQGQAALVEPLPGGTPHVRARRASERPPVGSRLP